MKTFLVVLSNGEKVYIEGNSVLRSDGIISIFNESDEKIAMLIDVALIVDESSIKKAPSLKPPVRP